MSQYAETRNRKSLSGRRKARSRTPASRRNHVEDPAPSPTLGSKLCLCFQKMNERILEPSTVRHLRFCFRQIPCIDNMLRKDGRTVPRSQPKYRIPKTRRQLELISSNSASVGHHKASYLRLPPLLDQDEQEHETREWHFMKHNASKIKVTPHPRPAVSLPIMARKSKLNLTPVPLRPHSPEILSSRPTTAEEFYAAPSTGTLLQNTLSVLPEDSYDSDLEVSTPPVSNPLPLRPQEVRRPSDVMANFSDLHRICRPHMTAKRSTGLKKLPVPNLQRLSQAPIIPKLDERRRAGYRYGINPKAMIPNIPAMDKKVQEVIQSEHITREISNEVIQRQQVPGEKFKEVIQRQEIPVNKSKEVIQRQETPVKKSKEVIQRQEVPKEPYNEVIQRQEIPVKKSKQVLSSEPITEATSRPSQTSNKTNHGRGDLENPKRVSEKEIVLQKEIPGDTSKKVFSPQPIVETTCRSSRTHRKTNDGRGDLEKPKRGSERKLKSTTLIHDSNSVLSKWGRVRALFIPGKGNIPVGSGPSFPKFERAVDLDMVEMKHLKASMARSRILEKKQFEARVRLKHWEQRRLIGQYKRRLRAENCVPNISIEENLETRFHHIHSFYESNNKRDSAINEVGRYFDKEKTRLVAIKIYGHTFAADVSERLQSQISALSEIYALMRLDHDNIVQMLTYFELEGRIHLMLESCDHDLRSEIDMANKGVPPKMIQRVVNQILNGLAFCHRNGFLHTDISPENILVTSDGVIKIADFDKAVFLHNEERRPWLKPGTVVYGAPELLGRKDNYGFASDVWSLGCIFAELLKGTPLWKYRTEEEQLVSITNSFKPRIPEDPGSVKRSKIFQSGPGRTVRAMMPCFPEDIMSFLLVGHPVYSKKCLEFEPHRRSTCKELLVHPFLKIDQDQDQAEKPVLPKWQSMTEAILPSRRLIYRPHSAPPPVEFDSNSCIDEYDLDSYLSSCISEISPRECTDQASTPFESQPGGDTSVGEPELTVTVKKEEDSSAVIQKVTWAQERRKGKRIRLKKMARVNEPEHNALVVTSELDTGRSTSYTLSNDEGSGTDRSRKAQRASRRRQSSWDPENTTDIGTDFTLCDANLRKHLAGKQVARVSMTDLTNLTAQQICSRRRNPESSMGDVPVTARGIMKHIIDSIPLVTWDSCKELCSHLNRLTRISPKLFTTQVNPLVTVLLQQIAIPKSKVAGPAIKILQTLYKIAPKPLEEETERILDAVLHKVGGPVFIDNSCCQVITEIVSRVPAVRVCTHLAKIGPAHRMGIGRAVAAKFLCDAVRRLNINRDIGDSTPAKRRFTCTIFETAIRYNRDTHVPTRDYAKELLVLLVGHSQFWRLYMDIVPDTDRARVNKVLDDIRRVKGDLNQNQKPKP